MAFTENLKEGQAKQDIKDATLFPRQQLAADKQHNREEYPKEWYDC